MEGRTKELLEYLDRTRLELHEAAEAVPVDRRGVSAAPGTWSVAEIIEHVSLVEGRVAVLLRETVTEAARTGTRDPGAGSVIDHGLLARMLNRHQRIEAPERARPVGQPWAESWASLDRSRAIIRTAAIAGEGLALGEIVIPHPALGPLTVFQWFVAAGGHEARHTAQIRETAAVLAASA